MWPFLLTKPAQSFALSHVGHSSLSPVPSRTHSIMALPPGAASKHLASLAKPPGSLGVLEDWAATACEVQGTLTPSMESCGLLVFCADHGVKKEDQALSPFPPVVTQAVFRALVAGLSATATLARSVGAKLTVVDCGIDGDVSDVATTAAKPYLCHSRKSG